MTMAGDDVVVVGGEVASAFSTEEELLNDVWLLRAPSQAGDSKTTEWEWVHCDAAAMEDPPADEAVTGGKKKADKKKKGKAAKKGKKSATSAAAAAAAVDEEGNAKALVFPPRTGHSACAVESTDVVHPGDAAGVAELQAAQEAAEEEGAEWKPDTVTGLVLFGGKTVAPVGEGKADGEGEEGGDADGEGKAGAEGEDDGDAAESKTPASDPAYLGDVWLLVPTRRVLVRKVVRERWCTLCAALEQRPVSACFMLL